MTTESSSRVDLVQVREFLEVVHGAGAGRGELVLYAQRGAGGRRTERRQAGVDLDPIQGLRVEAGAAAEEAFGLQELVDGGWDVYVTPCRFNPGRAPGTRRQGDVVWAPGVWVDLDVKPNADGGIRTAEEMERVVAALPEPTLLVDSGSGGRHAYWLLEEGTSDTRGVRRLGVRWLEYVQQVAGEALGRTLELDRVADLSRVMRLAGTWRQPGKAARDGITEPRAVVILGRGRRWDWGELESLIPGEITRRHDQLGGRALVRPGGKVDPADPKLAEYAEGRLENESDLLAQTGPGEGRNSRLNRAAWLMGTLGAVGLMDRDQAWDALVDGACRESGLLEEDGLWQCDATFSSGWDAGLSEPHHLPDMSGLDPHSRLDEIWPAPTDPLEVARRLVRDWQQTDGLPWVRYWRGDWMRRASSGAWEEVEELAVEGALYARLGAVVYQRLDERTGELVLTPWRPNVNKVGNVLRALKVTCLLEDKAEPPCLLGPTGHRDHAPARGFLVCRNGILNLASRVRSGHDPRLFTLVAVPFEHDPLAEVPGAWLRFLDELWEHDPEQIQTLQEVFGYVLSGRTDLQKIPLIAGPPRAGKGTIAQVLSELVGRRNVVGVSLVSLQNNFGLEPLLDKPLAVISDARLDGGGTDQLVERLLSISGEDTVTVDRKYKSSWTGRLPTRFLVLSNELPRMRDNSGAMARRFVTLQLKRSWYGEEDLDLLQGLLAELPGILNWALDGLARLEKTGRFTEGPASLQARATMEEAGSPVLAFVREHCEVGDDCWVDKTELYRAWSTRVEIRYVRGEAWFTRDLKSAVPAVEPGRRVDDDGTRRKVFFGIRLRQETE